MFFTVPEDAHWNAERQAVEFGVEIGEYRGRGQGPAARRWLSPFGPGKLLPLRVWDGFASRREARSPNWECVSAPRRDPTNQHRKILSFVRGDTQIPPGSANASRRAAMLTPSPKMSPSSTTMSPTLMPMRNSMRLSAGTVALRSVMPACTSDAQFRASTTLPN